MSLQREDELFEARRRAYQTGERLLNDEPSTGEKLAQWMSRIGWLLVGIVVLLLSVRMVRFAVFFDTRNDITRLIEDVSQPFAAPFLNLFNNPIGADGRLFELTSAFGILIYIVGAWLVLLSVGFLLRRFLD